MPDLVLQSLGGTTIEGISLECRTGTVTGICGGPATGKTSLLHLVAGQARTRSGSIRVGQSDITRASRSARPIYLLDGGSLKGRWSVAHALLAALHTRELPKDERVASLHMALEDWSLQAVGDWRIDELSPGQRARVDLAAAALHGAPILLAERPFEKVAASERNSLMNRFFANLRQSRKCALIEVGSFDELTHMDSLAILEQGRLIQSGPTWDVYRSPSSPAAARATGEISLLPAVAEGGELRSPIGRWPTDALEGPHEIGLRPSGFSVATGELESDFIFSISSARKTHASWELTGLVSGGHELKVSLPAGTPIERGRLIPLIVDRAQMVIFTRNESNRGR